MLARYIILGAIQGLTEFLPISSSGHLVIFQKLLHVAEDNVSFNIIVHLASLCAVIFFFRADLSSIIRNIFSPAKKVFKNHPAKPELAGIDYLKIALFIFYASLVTAVIGFKFEHTFELLFSSLKSVAAGLVFTGIVLFLTKLNTRRPRQGQEKPNICDGLIVGLAQGLAIAPGVSRSGLTICAALFRNIERGLAVRLSFLLSIPAIIGAALFKIKDLEATNIAIGYLSASFLSAFVFAFFSLKLLVIIVEKCKLHYFAYYCWLVAALIFYIVR